MISLDSPVLAPNSMQPQTIVDDEGPTPSLATPPRNLKEDNEKMKHGANLKSTSPKFNVDHIVKHVGSDCQWNHGWKSQGDMIKPHQHILQHFITPTGKVKKRKQGNNTA